MRDHFRQIATPLLMLAVLTMSAALISATSAKAADKSLHIGILSSGSPETRGGLEHELLEGLRERGYVEGKNLVVERRYASGKNWTPIPEGARELSGMKLDAIVTTCSPTTRAAKHATSSTPIVMAAVSDPVGQKFDAGARRQGD